MKLDLWSLARRIDFISKLKNSTSSIGKHELDFQGEVRFYNVYLVDLAFPCYRLANGRTQAAQKEYVSREGKPKDFFERDPDSEEALRVQDSILKDMVTKGTDSQILDILKRNPQTQPLILDSEGYVVNGNRRLCAMRFLYELDSEKYQRYEHVQVLFLPTCTRNDIDELEAKLQWRPDGRSEYSWVDKAIVLRQRQDNGWSLKKMADFYQMKTTEVRLWIAMLEDAEAYLEDRGIEGQYSQVLKKRLAFEKLQKGRKKCGTDEPKKKVFTLLSYTMLDDADATGGRLYEKIPDALKFLDDIVGQLDSEITDTNGIDSRDGKGSEDDLELLGDGSESLFEKAALLLRDPEKSEEIRDIVRDKIAEKLQDEAERKDALYCVRQAQKATTCLQNVKSNLDKKAKTDGLLALLEEIRRLTEQLRGTIENSKNSG